MDFSRIYSESFHVYKEANNVTYCNAVLIHSRTDPYRIAEQIKENSLSRSPGTSLKMISSRVLSNLQEEQNTSETGPNAKSP